ncbi:retrotransposable element Tf2 [Tanacetum coccineum]|uniref:Retrotransposable element Tf2 n=1 Tax=Tanacetum coccineum TaxID=301880 RepID=A0ABQ5J527_9ASTR
MKWLPKLLVYDNEIYYKKRSKKIVVDALSRVDNQAELASLIATNITNVLFDKIKESWVADPKLETTIKKFGWSFEGASNYKEFIFYGLLEENKKDGEIIEGFPSSQGNLAVLVAVDTLSKYAHFIALKHPFTASQVAQAFIEKMYKPHGLPATIMSTTYHPHSTGQTDVLEWFLRCMTGERPKEWTNVDRTLLTREQVIDMLKFHLKREQDRMNNQAEHKTDRSFIIRDWVYLKLQPYKQVSVRQNPYHKLSAKKDKLLVVQPMTILDRKLGKLNKNSDEDGVTWELYDDNPLYTLKLSASNAIYDGDDMCVDIGNKQDGDTLDVEALRTRST